MDSHADMHVDIDNIDRLISKSSGSVANLKEPATSSNVSALLKEMSSYGVSFHGDCFAEDGVKSRKQLLVAARALCLELETPIEAILRIAWAEPALGFAVRVAIDLSLFEKLAEDSSIPKSSSQLAASTGANATLLGRILKHLSAMGILREVEADIYASTPLSDALILPKYRDGIPFRSDVLGPVFANLPEYLAQNGYENPENSKDGPFQFGHKTPLVFFDWLKAHPESMEDFNNHMIGYAEQASWLNPGCYPVEELLGKGANQDKHAVLLVDVGGGLGQVIEEFHRKYPSLPGRLILQDQSTVIKEVIGKIHDSIEPMEHDFFTPQPIIGARAYYMRSIFHSYPDDRCRSILLNLIPALQKGYSKILISDMVIPDRHAHWISTGLDLMMMASFPSRERTEKQWHDLMASVGLKVVRIWTFEEGFPSLIEADLE